METQGERRHTGHGLHVAESSPSSSNSSFLSSSSSSSSPSYCLPLYRRLWLCVVLAFALPSIDANMNVRVTVPRPGVVGRPARLGCHFQTGRDGFYSVRWYKDNEQFYSYVPKNEPTVKVDHGLDTIDVQLSESDKNSVTLREVRRENEGVYRCEVMGSAPMFRSNFAEANMSVAVTPAAVLMSGAEGRQTEGSQLNVTCTARDAWPHPTLTFLIDGNPLQPGQGSVVLLRDETVEESGSRQGLHTTTVQLLLPVTSDLTLGFELGCRARVRGLDTFTRVPVEVAKETSGGGSSLSLPILLVPLVQLLFVTFPAANSVVKALVNTL